jgi:hypothetical protein
MSQSCGARLQPAGTALRIFIIEPFWVNRWRET